MSHLISTMAYVGQTPWHGLGEQLPPKQGIDVWTRQAGMDWQIEAAPVHYAPGEALPARPYPDQRVLYRSDTHAPLSIVSGRYHVVQPREMLEFYRDLTEAADFELETAGVLKGGRKLWALARTGREAVLPGQDRVKGYLLLATSCDGTLATTVMPTSVRVVCNNTLRAALDTSVQAVKVPHRQKFDPVQVKRQLGLAVSHWDRFIHGVKRLADRPVAPTEVEPYFRRVLGLPAASASPDVPVAQARALQSLQALYGGEGRGAGLRAAQGTSWGLLNAVTEFVDHHRRALSAENRLDSAWFGLGAALKDRAFDEARLLADA